MKFELPKVGKKPTAFPHFPTRVCAFVFRALEFFSYEKIASILGTTAENIRYLALSMGVKEEQKSDVWLRKGYITIIRAMWHLLPYEQLLELLEIGGDELAVLLREEDFLDIKLKEKPDCRPLHWEPLTQSDRDALQRVRASMEPLSLDGKAPFDFQYIMPDVAFSGREVFGTRMIYLFSGLYQKSFDVDSREYCSDELLESYRRVGINGIYTQGVLYMLSRFPFEPSLSEGWQKRLENLKDLTERCAKYGIKVYLYLNEPRSMHKAFFKKYPHIKGHVEDDEHVCLCTSTKEVQDYIKNAVETVCKAAPLLGGFFCMAKSENLTNCYSHVHQNGACNCPRCRDRSIGEVIGEFFAAVREGADRVSPDIKVFDYSWDGDDLEARFDVIDHLPERVAVESICESRVPYEIGGVKSTLEDYSLNIIGPGERSLAMWERAKARGLETVAKLQINTTWECSTVPALPVFDKVDRMMQKLVDVGVDHLQLSWTLGGYPSPNLLYACKYFFEHAKVPQMSDAMQKAGKIFSEAFSHFPSHIRTAYMGPQNAGPATLFYEAPTGYDATMTCFAYDDVKSWAGVYPTDVFEAQLQKLCDGWEQGLALIEHEEDRETVCMAKAAYSLFRASLNLTKFIRLRDNGGTKAELYAIVLDERENAKEMLRLMNDDPAIGFEAANHYYFSRFGLCEKIINCEYLLQTYST